MGRELIRAVPETEDLELAAVWTRRDAAAGANDVVASRDIDEVLAACDVAIDFTLPAATPRVLEAAARAGKPLVCGVSGLDDSLLAQMRSAAKSVPILYDRNMSFGIAVITELVRRAAAALGPQFVAEIRETHHVHKRDAPSGTALKLGEALADARGKDFRSVYRYEDDGLPRRSSPDEILISATRKGENPGEHTVVFRSESETLELVHRVRDRRVFALGALQAARWLLQQPPGLSGMGDLARSR
jgi:4-hydroxy-tetrahydrodipicolinate reductase